MVTRINTCVAEHRGKFTILSKLRSERWWAKHNLCDPPTTTTRITPEVEDAILTATRNLDIVANVLIATGQIGFAAEVGDARDLLTLLLEDRAADNLAG